VENRASKKKGKLTGWTYGGETVYYFFSRKTWALFFPPLRRERKGKCGKERGRTCKKLRPVSVLSWGANGSFRV